MSITTLRKSNTLDKLLAQVQSESAPQESKSYVDERLWKPELDKSGTGQLFVFCLHQMVKSYLGLKCSNTHFSALLVNGTLRIL